MRMPNPHHTRTSFLLLLRTSSHDVLICFYCILMSRLTRAPPILSDLSRRHLPTILMDLIYGAFAANWKQGDDPNDFGNAVFGIDANLELKYVEEYLRWLSCFNSRFASIPNTTLPKSFGSSPCFQFAANAPNIRSIKIFGNCL